MANGICFTISIARMVEANTNAVATSNMGDIGNHLLLELGVMMMVEVQRKVEALRQEEKIIL